MTKIEVCHIVFDWSGTISDDFRAVFTTTNEILERFGAGRLSEKQYREVFDLPVINFYRIFFPEPDFEAYTIMFRERWPVNTALYPLKPIEDAAAHLDAIRATGKPCSIISAHYDVVKESDRYFPGKNYFADFLVSAHEKDLALLEFAQKHGIEPAKIAYVGDMMGDIRAAKKAGAIPIAVTTGYHSREQLEKQRPYAVITNLGELIRIIR